MQRMCIGFRVGLDESQHPRLHFPGQPGVAQRAQALVTHPRLHLPGSRSLQSMQESARLHLNDHRSLEEMQASMQRCHAQYSREKRQAAAALGWAKRRAPK
jgi:hypothetical protein